MAAQFSNAFAQYGGVEITIHKRIRGSWVSWSTDAAAVLVGLDCYGSWD